MSMSKSNSPAALWARYEAALNAAGAAESRHGKPSGKSRAPSQSTVRRTTHRTAKEASR
jgi:hypothetical protein